MKFNMNVRAMLNLWEKFRAVPGGALLYSRLIGKFIPYTGSVNLLVLELRPGHAKVQLTDRRAVRNHLGSIHAAAIMNFAEAASGLALNYTLPENGRAILVNFNIKYTKKARGTLVAISNVKLDPITSSHDEIIESTVTDADGDIVAHALATWRVGLNPKRGSEK
jgi:acyl-coenzyme A thioesterase PaaI-like protein